MANCTLDIIKLFKAIHMDEFNELVASTLSGSDVDVIGAALLRSSDGMAAVRGIVYEVLLALRVNGVETEAKLKDLASKNPKILEFLLRIGALKCTQQ